ncbi:hypothetical protein M086_4262, partial [Bacteroides fragilis str. S13 L11]
KREAIDKEFKYSFSLSTWEYKHHRKGNLGDDRNG